MKKFKKPKGWVSPEQYGRILKLLLSPNDEDFEIGVALCEKENIKPSRLFNQNSKEAIECDWVFKMKFGKLTRSNKTAYNYWVNGVYIKDYTRI